MADLIKLKKRLKEWESSFFTVHQRKPYKDDISNAPDAIKALYRAYHSARCVTGARTAECTRPEDPHQQDVLTSDNNTLKGCSQPDSSQVSAWGPELNKKPLKNAIPMAAEIKQDANGLLSKLGDKLFATHKAAPSASKTDKKLPQPKRVKKSETLLQNTTDSTLPTPVSGCVISNENTSPSKSSQPSDTRTSAGIASNEGKILVTGERFEKPIKLAIDKKTPRSQEDIEVPKKFLCLTKSKRQFAVKSCIDRYPALYGDIDLNTEQFGINQQVNDEVSSSSKVLSQLHSSAEDSTHSKRKIINSIFSKHAPPVAEFDKMETDLNSTGSMKWNKNTLPINERRRKTSPEKRTSSLSSDMETAWSITPSMSNMYVCEAETDGVVTGDGLDSKLVHQASPSVMRHEQNNGGNIAVKAKRTEQRKLSAVDDDDESDNNHPNNQPQSTQYAKRRKVTAPETLSIARKTENYVRLNMKAKQFTRKKTRMTGNQWKRKQWKQKTSIGGKNYGDQCFKCGQSGHWARKCPGKSVASTETNTSQVSENDFPSLTSAALMARGIRSEETVQFEGDEEVALETMVDRERHEPGIQVASVKPISHLITDVETEVEKGLKKFGFSSFRKGQKETITRILNGQSTLVILSTGGGKSLCYQLPAYLYAQHAQGFVLVVSPLVSLMEDQVTGLPPGVRGACLNSNMSVGQRNRVLAEVNAGKVHFLLVSPEAVVGGSGCRQGSFPSSDQLPPIFFACIDEVHCLSEWSHNFRPSYLRLCKVLRENYGVSCFLGLTATATESTATDVIRHLGIKDLDAAIVRGSPIPSNLCLSVSRDENKDEALLNLLQGKRFASCMSVIIYCTRRGQVEKVATLIRTQLSMKDRVSKLDSRGIKGQDIWSVESYHAGLTPTQRKQVQKRFMNGTVRVVVATVAFGMGLDKADVRGIIHYNMPKSFDNYVQEIGRAGRDGETSHCHLFLDPDDADLTELQRHTFGNSVDRHTLKKLIQRVFKPCKCEQVQHLKAFDQVTGESNKSVSSTPSSLQPSSSKPPSSASPQVASVSSLPVTGEGDNQRVCPGHERALIIDQLVNDLDVREEGIETLLCYLELHAPRLLTNMSPAYATCQLDCYGGPAQLQAVAKKCPVVAAAIAKQKLRGANFSTSNSVQFGVVDVSDTMGWQSGPVKRELKALEWSVTEQGSRKSGVLVGFTDLAFRLRASGDVSDQERDDLLDLLQERVQRQERAELTQLAMLTKRLKSVSHKNYWMCADEADVSRSIMLKQHLDDHFKDKNNLSDAGVEEDFVLGKEESSSTMTQLRADIRNFIDIYGSEHALTGRAVARILHGIHSPRFPATVWGRIRRFWRSQLHVHFNLVLREASRQLLQKR